MDGAFYDREDLVTEMARRLPKLTAAEVNAAVRRHLKTSGMHVAIVTQNAEALARALKANASTPITYDTQGTPDSILNEDKIIAAFPLKDLNISIVPVESMFEK
jgi:zinc protease